METFNRKKRISRRLLSSCLFFLFTFLCSAGLMAQTVSVKGSVRDTDGTEIIGASILVKGTTSGTVSDFDGSFTINCSSDAVLVVSYIGYNTKEIPVNGQTNIDIVISESGTDLDELVVIGYGVVKKRDLTGSVSSIKAGDIERVASNNAMEAMQGRIPGLDVTKSSGEAGAGLNMNLRGTRSISAQNNPLILVDGVEYGSTIDINPSDIESMEVLKDASSTAIYGTRGANGVVIITTKRGKAGKTRVNVNAYLSSNIPTHVPEVMNATDDVRMLIERKRYTDDAKNGWGSTVLDKYSATDVLSSGVPPGRSMSDLDIYNSGRYVDWMDMVLQNGLTQNYEASVSGGSESTNFSISLGAMYEEGLLENDKMGRYNVKVNLDHKINDRIKIGTSLLYTYKNWDRRDGRVFTHALKLHSIAEAYNTDGDIIVKPNPNLYEAGYSPLLDDVEGRYENNIKTKRFFGNVYGEWNIIEGLRFKTMFGLDQKSTRDGLYDDYESVGGQQASGSTITVSYEDVSTYTWENTLNYVKSINKDNEITALLGHSMIESILEGHGISGTTLKEHYPNTFYDLNNIVGLVPFTNDYQKTNMLSFFGRVNYKLMDKYLLTASLRADGSSVLAEGNKWDYFPSVAGSWIINEESFLKDVRQIDNLKLRLSWGISGNAAVLPYQTQTSVGKTPVYYSFTSLTTGQVPAILGNKDLKWEKTNTYNLGIDFGLFRRVTGSIDLYIAKTNDLLLYKSLPPTSVYPQYLANVGSTENKGIEITLNTLVVDKKDFSWDINWSFASNKDKIKSLVGGKERDVTNPERALVVGESVSAFYDFEADGCWSIADAAEYNANKPTGAPDVIPGAIRVKDMNNDGYFDDEDKRIYNKSPKFVFGMSNNLRYRDFTLAFSLFARSGQWIKYEYNDLYKPTDQAASAAANFWTPENQSAKFPRPGIATDNKWSSLQMEKASYLKIKDITLAYNLPKHVLSNIGFSKVRVFGSLKNFFTFSSIDNYDPERDGNVTFPLAKQVVFGVNLEF